MRQKAAIFEAFYASMLGRRVAERVGQRLIDLWGHCQGRRLLGIGFAVPLLQYWHTHASTCIGAIPQDMGESRLRGLRGQVLCLTPEDKLPFAEGVFERVFLLHALEEAVDPNHLLREVWRVTEAEGRVVAMVTNRKSFWSLDDSKPFGHGRSWTRRQLTEFLNDNLFQVMASATAVHMPPLNWPVIAGASKLWERAGETVLPDFGGVILVEAVKRLYAKPGRYAPARPVRQTVKTGHKGSILPDTIQADDDGYPQNPD